MNLNQLKYFHAVCVYGSLSEAAECLYISQPSLSSAIKRLEDEFGVTLFRRRHQGMELTEEGKALFEMCGDILTRADRLERVMKDMGNAQSRLRLGVPPMLGSLVLPYLYREFCDAHPNITLEILEGGRDELIEKLSDHALDMIFLVHNNALDAKFGSAKVACLEIVCCASQENEIASLQTATPQRLQETPLVLFENSFFQAEAIKKWFARERITPNIILQTEQLSTMLTLIANNAAVGFAFRQLTETNPAFRAIQIEPPMFADVSLVWNKNSYRFECMETFKKYFREKKPFDLVGQVSLD